MSSPAAAPDLLRCALPAPSPEAAAALGRPFLRAAVCAALAAARVDPKWATPALAAHFRAERRLGSKDRKRVQDAVYGVIRSEALLRRAGLGPGEPEVEGWAALLAGDRLEDLASEGATADYATALSLPVEVAGPWLEALGPAEAAAFAQHQLRRGPVTLRANRLRCDREGLAARLADEGVETRPVAGLPDALELVGAANLVPLASARAGWFEVQDRSSQALIELIAALLPLRGLEVLDRCAGAGGKALALAARGARVSAADTRPAALRELQQRAQRAGAEVKIGLPGRKVPLVLVDAPCSGTGRLQREPALRWGLDVATPQRAQAALLADAAERVSSGGIVVYATCSLVAAENTPPTPAGLRLISRAERWPHREGGDGFSWSVYEAR
ncbi:MAG: hypothetical protein JNM72_11420 [Deltaproteobacteria bacterium]|nr:hypothetical protein [Deltaproteobacteria bacterium]